MEKSTTVLLPYRSIGGGAARKASLYDRIEYRQKFMPSKNFVSEDRSEQTVGEGVELFGNGIRKRV